MPANVFALENWVTVKPIWDCACVWKGDKRCEFCDLQFISSRTVFQIVKFDFDTISFNRNFSMEINLRAQLSIQHRLIDNLSIFNEFTYLIPNANRRIGKRFLDGFDKMRSTNLHKILVFFTKSSKKAMQKQQIKKSRTMQIYLFSPFRHKNRTVYLDT